MLESFKSFVNSEDYYGCPVATIDPGTDLSESVLKEINYNLSDSLTEESFSWPMIGYEAIGEILNEYGISLPEQSFLDSDDKETRELIYIIEGTEENPLFLYILKEQDERGEIEFYAEMVDEKGLNELLNSIPIDEGDNEAEDE